MYSARLAGLRARCLENAQLKLKETGVNENDVEVVDRIIGVKEKKLSILVGTIVKEMDPKRRPNVASAYNDKDTCSFLFPEGMFADGSSVEGTQESLRSHIFDTKKGDVLHLEDESGRVELCAEEAVGDGMDIDNADGFDPNKVCTGVVAAVIGEVSAEKGVMHVRSIHFAGAPPSSENAPSTCDKRSSTLDDKQSGEPMILLISGLACGRDFPSDIQTDGCLALRREMLLEYLTNSQLGNGATVSRVILAGGGVGPKSESTNTSNKENGKFNGTNGSKSKKAKHESSPMALSLSELDLYFSEILGSGIPVDYVPGWHDPTNANWPQRPIHSCLLPNSCSFVDLFQRSTNPYESVVGDVKILGSDGLNVNDLKRFLTDTVKDQDEGEKGQSVSSLEALRQTLKYGHIAPTGPDSLPMFPSSESDPFILSKQPSVYFAGNSEKFETLLVDNNGEAAGSDDDTKKLTRLICVPSFALTGEAVLLNLNTLDCEVISFNDVGL